MMCKTVILASCVLAMFLSSGCSSPPHDTRADPALLKAVGARIDRLNAIYDTCMQVRNDAFFTEWYMPDACTMPEGVPRVCGRQAIADMRWNNGESKVFRLALHTEYLSGDSYQILETGNYVVSTTLGAALDKGKYMVLWRPDTDKLWKIQQEIWNSDLPHDAPPDTLSAMEG